jgi:hypothetical protein
LAAWQCQEDAAHAQVLAKEADIQRRREDTFRTITNGFAIDLDILAVKMASWHGTDNAMALLAMKHRKDNANVQGYLDGHAVRALQKVAVHVNVLAASCPQEDDAHAKAFASEADKRNCREATLRAAQLKYVAQLGFTSSNQFFALVAECNASQDGAVVEAPNRTLVLAERASADNKEAAGRTRNSTTANMATTVFVEDMQHEEMAGTAHHWAVAECNTALVLPTSGDNALALMMMPSATPMAVLSSPPTLLCMWARSYPILRDGLTQHLLSLHRCLNLWRSLDHLQPTANLGRYIAVHNLVVALADAIVLKCPVLLPRW